jgi:hypothetical protein
MEEEAGRLLTNVKGRASLDSTQLRLRLIVSNHFFSSLSCCSAGRGEEEEMENVDVSLDFCVSDALRVCVPW